jgi:hypothetical protein
VQQQLHVQDVCTQGSVLHHDAGCCTARLTRNVPPVVSHVLQVILIHLSNLTGLADDYNKRTMSLLVSDIGTIVMGVTAAIASGYVKVT